MTDADSKLYCILGNPVRHSMSPHIHNASFKEIGFNGVYVAFEVENAVASVQAIRALGIMGASVTIPHKIDVMPVLDEIDDVAEMIGAVNTIVNRDGKLFGLNTDGPGAVKALKDAGVEPKGKKVVLIGSGGAARAVAFALAANEKIADITVMGVIKNEMEVLVDRIKEKTGAVAWTVMLSEREDIAREAVISADIVINASPVGMHPKEDVTPIPVEWISPETTVFDVVYNPLETKLIEESAKRGCRTVRGVEMFINQAVLQFECWTREKAPEELMRKIVLENLEGK